jgi:hypothetical protein
MNNDSVARFLREIRPQTAMFYDNLKFVVPPMKYDQQERFLNRLKENANFADIRPGEWPRDFESILTVVNPNDRALRILARQPLLTPRYGEIACDMIVSEQAIATKLHKIFDRHFVQPWHGTHETRHDNISGSTTYTGQERPGHHFTFYSDRPSKRTRDPFCFHFEARYTGIVALRQIGINDASDLLPFDRTAFFHKNIRLYKIDFARLRRWHENQRTGTRLRSSQRWRNDPTAYDEDYAIGERLFAAFGRHPYEGFYSVQRFVDQYGRGPFLREIDVSSLLPPTADTITDHVYKNQRSTFL